MSFFNLFKPDPPSSQIEDDTEIKTQYRYWRFRVFYSMYIGYALFYFTRKSFTFAMPALIDLGFEISSLGLLSSLLAFSYGVSKFLSGILSDRANLRYFMGIGLIMTGVLNVFVGLSSSILMFAIFLTLNGLFQGWGSPPCARLLTYWYSQKERGRWWGVWNTSHNIGGALIPLMSAFAIQLFGWRYAMHLPGIFAIIAGFFLINRIRDNPMALGLPSIEKFRNDYAIDSDERNKEEDEGPPKSSKEILVENVLKNKYIWVLAISFFFVYVIRQAVNDWTQLYLIKSKGYSEIAAGFCVFWFEIGGIFGSLAAGSLSDTVFKGKRGPVNVLFSIGIISILLGLWMLPSASIVLISALTFFAGFLIFGPQMLIGMAAAEFAGKKAAGTATGFAGFFAYAGGAAAGYPFGRVIEVFGWNGFFILLSVCGIIAVALLVPLWNRRISSEIVQAGS